MYHLAKMHSITDGWTQTDRRQYHANSRLVAPCIGTLTYLPTYLLVKAACQTRGLG